MIDSRGNGYQINFQVIKQECYTKDLEMGFHLMTHSKVSKCSNTIVLVQTRLNRIFGGFVSIPWNESNAYRADKHAFIISLSH